MTANLNNKILNRKRFSLQLLYNRSYRTDSSGITPLSQRGLGRKNNPFPTLLRLEIMELFYFYRKQNASLSQEKTFGMAETK